MYNITFIEKQKTLFKRKELLIKNATKSELEFKKILDETINTFLLIALYLELSEPYESLKKLCSNIIFEEDDLNLHLKGTEIFTLPFLNS